MNDYLIHPQTYRDKLQDAGTGMGPLLLLLVLFLLAGALSSIPWLAPDWERFYRPAALAIVPNDIPGNYTPPWTALALWPIAILGDDLSKGVLTLATLFVCRLYVGNWRRFAILCFTLPFAITVYFGQIDALSLIGLMVPAELSLLFLSMKPQGAALAALKGRLTVWSVCAILVMLIVSFLLWGWWPGSLLARTDWSSDCSPWPWGIPFGVALLIWQWKRGFDSDCVLCVATLLLTPYFFLSSLLPATACAIRELDDDWASMFVIVGLTWAYIVVRRIGF